MPNYDIRPVPLHARVLQTRAERLENPGMEGDRADVIVGGVAILVKVMRQMGFDECLVSESDILDGLVASQQR